ncbi:MAG TPA: sigma-70 family RNA polymerase sigma factor [Streptosporangiaceae bacterium]|nr:sigma-70 family RNA polymerase sigma factor [Streptosporangiaceae bacterium]
MHVPRSGGPGVQTVIAAQAGDAEALDSLLSSYLPLIYNIVGRGLSGHADVDDVVQETMLRAVRGLGDLRDPAAFRSWLVAVAIRQMRDHYRARQAVAAADLSDELADPEADFVELTILRLGLSSQREETAQATRWLDAGDRELLALWWLEAAGELDRDELVAALGLPATHVAVRIGRLKEQLTTCRVVVRALRADPPCSGLEFAIADWDGGPSPLWRKRIARHIRACRRCGAQQDGLIPAERLLAGLTLVPLPAAMARAFVPPPGARASGTQVPGTHASRTQAHGTRALRRAAGHSRHARILAKAGGSVPAKLAAVTVAASCVVAAGAAVVHLHGAQPAAAIRPVQAAPAAPPTPVTQALARSSPKPVRTTRPPRKTAPPPPASNAKKGAGAWAFTGAGQALAQSGASWYYTWSASPAVGVSSAGGPRFVPLIWGAANVNAGTLSEVRGEGPYLLGFNEPDMSGQANMSPARALSLWPQLMATGLRLGSPAVASGGATPGGWLDQFMSGAQARGYRVNFITLHWYGSDFATGPAVSQLESYLQAVHARYHKPIWLTEFALANFGGSPQTPSRPRQAAFLTAATAMLQRLSYVQRYAWFGLEATASDGSMGLFRSGPAVTTVGRAFEAAG